MRAALERQLRGLASGGVYIANCITAIAGGLLHHRFILTNISIGGLLSVALFPRIAPGGRYPPPCSVDSGLSSVSCDNAVIRATLLIDKDTADKAARAIAIYALKVLLNKGLARSNCD